MVCLTTFGNTKRVISLSLIIFLYILWLCPGARCALQRVSLLNTSLSTSTGGVAPPPLKTIRPVTELLPFNHIFPVISRRTTSATCVQSLLKIVQQFLGTRSFFFKSLSLSVRFRIRFMSNMEWQKPKMKQRRRSCGAVSGGRLTGGSCQLFTGSQFRIWIQCLWHLFKCFGN